jgi:hypothetical protein
MVLLEHGEPRREAIVRAFERAGYRLVPEPAADDSAGYRDAATPSLSLRFVFPRRGNHQPVVKTLHVWRADVRTMAYTVVCAPLWLVQAMGVVIGIVSVVVAFMGDPMHRPWIVGLIAAGVLFGLPKLWLDDMRQLLRDALEDARAADAAPDAVTEPVTVKQRVEPVADEKVRVGTDDPALAAAARTARDGVVRHPADDPEDLVEELEREARRGERGE